MMSYQSIDVWWWPFAFIFLAGIVPTAMWRWAGAMLGGTIRENSSLLVLVRCIATSLVAAVIAQLIVYPSGALADVPLFIRLGAAGGAFVAFFLMRRSMFWAIIVSQVLLIGGVLTL